MKNIVSKFFSMKIFKKKSSKKFAFSLVELSVVVTVLAVVTTGILSVSAVGTLNSKTKVSTDRIKIIYKALGTYVSVNKKLPCPAPITAVKNSINDYGTALTSCDSVSTTGIFTSGNLVYGMLPVKTLGLSNDLAEDEYGNKFAYVVDKNFTNASTNPFLGSTSGSIVVKKYVSKGLQNGNLTENSSNALFAIIGYGANQNGAYPSNSSSPIGASGIDPYEQKNFSTSFVQGVTQNYLVSYSDYSSYANKNLSSSVRVTTLFDDNIFYKTKESFLLDAGAFSLANSNSSNIVRARPGCVYPSQGDYPNSNSQYNGGSGSVSLGGKLYLSCKGGYGNSLGSGGDSSCGRYATDRSSTPPNITCNNDGTWSVVSNDCVACRNCNSSTAIYTGTLGCAGQYTSGKGTGNYDCYYVEASNANYQTGCTSGNRSHGLTSCSSGSGCIKNVSHLAIQYFCQRQEHGNDSSGTLGLKCIDGQFTVKAFCSGGNDAGGGHNNYYGSTSCATAINQAGF